VSDVAGMAFIERWRVRMGGARGNEKGERRTGEPRETERRTARDGKEIDRAVEIVNVRCVLTKRLHICWLNLSRCVK